MQEKISNIAINSVIDRLKTYFQVVNDGSLADILGVKQNTLSTWRSRNAINYDLIFAKCENINLNWLIFGVGEMTISNIAISEETSRVNRYLLKSDISKVEESVPLYNIEAAAGVVAIFDNLKTQKPLAYLQIPNLPKCDGAIYVVGDSMYPILKSGDIVAYKVLNNLKNIYYGEMYVLSILSDGDSFITVKYVQESEKTGFVRLVSHNQHHQPKEIPFDCIKFAALVKASIRFNSMG